MPPTMKRQPQAVDSTTIKPTRLVVYADPKVGKTTLGLSFPRPLIVNTDEGLEGDALDQLQDNAGIEVFADGYKDLEGLYFYCRDNADKYDSIFIDSGDELIHTLLDEIVAEGAGGRDGSNSGALGETFFDVVPEQGEYLANQRQMHTFLTTMRKLGKHMIVSFGVREGAGTSARASFNTSPGMQKPVLHFASTIARLQVAPADSDGKAQGGAPFKKGQRLLNTDAGSRTSQVGTRFKSLTPYIVDPTFDKLWGLMYPGATNTNEKASKA